MKRKPRTRSEYDIMHDLYTDEFPRPGLGKMFIASGIITTISLILGWYWY
jgi:hypothetical protein